MTTSLLETIADIAAPSVPPTRINAVPQIERALHLLTTMGYDTGELWREHNMWLALYDERKPTARDVAWAKRNAAPAELTAELPTLSAAQCFGDRQFLLTPGQRDILRDKFGLTPTKVVVVQNVALFKDSVLVSGFTLKSAEHVDPRLRTKVLNSVYIHNAAEFFELGHLKDKEREAAREEADAEKVKAGGRPRTAKNLALQYIE